MIEIQKGTFTSPPIAPPHALLEASEYLNQMIRILESADFTNQPLEDDEQAKVGSLFELFRQTLELSKPEMAHKMGVSTKTIQRWGATGLPLKKAKRLQDLIEVQDQQKPSTSSIFTGPGDLKIGSRNLDYLLEREAEAESIWVIKTFTPFNSGMPGPTRDLMIRLMKEKGTKFNFLFYDGTEYGGSDPRRVSRFPARDSFYKFKKSLLVHERIHGLHGQLYSLARGWRYRYLNFEQDTEDIGNALETHFGVDNLFGSIALFVYTEEGKKVHNRSIDLFVELPMSLYTSDGEERMEQICMAWFELHRRNCREYLRNVETYLERINQAPRRIKIQRERNVHRSRETG